MATIPDYTAIPDSVPSPSYRRVQVDDSGEQVAQAFGSIGDAFQRVDQRQRQQADQLADAKAQNSVENHNLALQTTAETMRQQIASGEVPYAQARDQFDEQVQKIPPPSFDGLRPQVATLLQGRVQRNTAVAQFGIDRSVDAARKDDFKAQFGQGLDTLGKLAGMPDADVADINARADVYRPLGRNAGLPEAFIDKSIQDFKDKNWLNQATQRSMEARDSMPDLHELQHDLTDANGFYAGKLDTDKRNMVLRSVLSDQSSLQNRMDTEANKREMKAQRTIGQIDEQIASGVPATSDMWDQWQHTTQGTTFADDFKQRLKDEEQVQQVLHQPIAQQQNYVQQRQQQLDTAGGSLKDLANLNRLKVAVNQNVNLMQKAPLLFGANRNGTEVAPLDFSALNPNASAAAAATGGQDPKQQFSAQIADRMTTLKALQKQYGPTISSSPLLPQEASALAGQLDNSPPKQAAQMLVGLRSAANDDVAYQNIMRQIAPHSPVTAIAGTMVNSSAPASTPAWFDQNFAPKLDDVAHILSGDSLLNPNKAATGQQEKGELKSTVPMPSDGTNTTPGLRDAFINGTGGVKGAKDLFRDRPELGEAYFAAFKAADAGLRAEAGDLKGEPNGSIEKQALKIALGNTVDFNGAQVKVPDGMDPSKFKGYVNNAVAAAVQASGGGKDWADRLEGYRLHEVGGVGTGRYAVMDGPIPFARPDGKGHLEINLRQQFSPQTPQTAQAGQ